MVLLHLALVGALLGTAWLGVWQLGAWQGHREDRVAALADLDPVAVDGVLGPDDPLAPDAAGRPVSLVGQWLDGEVVTVTGRVQHGDTGRWVVAPFAVCPDGACTGEESVIPVVLGWTDGPEGAAVPEPTGRAEIVARLQPAEQDDASDPDPTDDVLTSLRIPDFVTRLDQDLYSAFAILDEPAAARGELEAVTPDALPRPAASTGLRNLLYGLQWFVFGGFAVVVWWRWTRDELALARGERTGPEGPDAPDGPEEATASGRSGGSGAAREGSVPSRT